MLNELYDLWQACERVQIQLPIRIPGLDEGQNEDGLRVFLRKDGSISRIEAVPGEQMKRIRKWKCGEGITLPVFNFEPLHAIRLRGKQALAKRFNGLELRARERLLRRSRPIRWETGPQSRRQKLAGAFKNVSGDLSQRIGADASPDGDAWRALIETLQRVDVEVMFLALSKALQEHLGNGPSNDCSLDVLFQNATKDKASTTPVQFEPEGTFSAPVYSRKAQEWLAGVLAKTLIAGEKEDEAESVSVGGVNRNSTAENLQGVVWGKADGSLETYRDVKLPVLGKASLFNRDVKNKPTSARYDGGKAIFPVGQDVRMKLMAAIEWLAAEERKGKTWVVRGKPKKEGVFLLFTYLCERMDSTPEHLVEVFAGPPDDESDQVVVKFETLCGGVARALDGIPQLSDSAQIKIFALHKPDGYRAQVFASESFTKGGLKSLAHAWQSACRLHPPIVIPQFVQQGEDSLVRQFEPSIPFPYQAIECLNTVWEKCEHADDAKSDSASDYDLADAFELLRRTGSRPMDAAYLGRMLDLAVRRALPLMRAVAQAMHQTRNKVFVARGDNARHATKSLLHAQRWPCLLALLLHRLGYQLKKFMKEPAYLIGRFLAQLDRLHGYYAKHVSGKEDGLRQLLGNALMATALESPLRAFELAGQRMLPYQAWGRSFAHGRKSKDALGAASDDAKFANSDKWEVHHVLEELGQIAEALSDLVIPETNRAVLPAREGHESKEPAKQWLDLTDTLKAKDRAWVHADSAAKAQMLLGYLARPDRENSTANPKTENTPKPLDFDEVAHT
jgi:hypothetical protein